MYKFKRAVEIHVGAKILALELAPYTWCPNLLAVATEDSIGIYDICFREDDPTAFPDNYIFLEEFTVGKDFKCGIISFSPLTKPLKATRVVSLACADPSNPVFRYYGYDNESWVEFGPHQSVVNDIAFEPITGDKIASVGDDKAIILSLENQVMAEFDLKSPGISVSWHKDEEGKIMVGERSGIITLYDLKKKTTESSFDCHVFPLRCVKWCPSNSLLIGGVTDDKWFIWNMNQSEAAIVGELTYKAASFRFSNVDDDIYTVRSESGTELTLIYKNFTNVDCDDLPEGNAISFHAHRNFFVVGGEEVAFIVKIYTSN